MDGEHDHSPDQGSSTQGQPVEGHSVEGHSVASRPTSSPRLLAGPWWRRAALVAVLGALWGLAFWMRLQMLHSAPFTSEAAHYVMARDLWDGSNNLYGVDGSHSENPWLFWQRPMLALLLWPGARISFEAYRLLHMAVASLLPVMAVLVLRQAGVRWAFTVPAAVVIALHVRFVPWGTLVMPDSLLAVLLLGGLLAYQRGAWLAMAVLLWLATWVKEIGAVAVAGLLVAHVATKVRVHEVRLWPLQLDKPATALAAVGVVAFLPLLYSLARGGWFPGLAYGGDWRFTVEAVTLVPWLLPFPFLALAFPRLRPAAAMAAAWVLFFFTYRFVMGKAVELWYPVASSALALVCVAGVLDEAWTRARAASRLRAARSPLARWAAPAATAAVAVALAVVIAVPMAVASTSEANRTLATPISGWGLWTMGQVWDYEDTRSKDLAIVLDRMPDRVDTLVAVDLDWSFVMHPVAERADRVLVEGTAFVDPATPALDAFVVAVETANYTLVFDWDHPLNVALRETYAPCLVTHDVSYTIYDARPCAGRRDELVQRHNELKAGRAPQLD